MNRIFSSHRIVVVYGLQLRYVKQPKRGVINFMESFVISHGVPGNESQTGVVLLYPKSMKNFGKVSKPKMSTIHRNCTPARDGRMCNINSEVLVYCQSRRCVRFQRK